MKAAAGALLVALLCASAPAAAGSAREAALAALGDRSDAEARRRGAQQLAEAGTMADLPRLAEALRDPDGPVRAYAEVSMWQVWSRSGDADVDLLLALGVEQMTRWEGLAAVETFTRIIERRPQFAEGWNKRATVRYLMGEFRKSIADCEEVLRRNPYHFGALSGYGMNLMQLDQPGRALDYFERALAVNPNLQQVEETAQTIRELLMRRRRDSI